MLFAHVARLLDRIAAEAREYLDSPDNASLMEDPLANGERRLFSVWREEWQEGWLAMILGMILARMVAKEPALVLSVI